MIETVFGTLNVKECLDYTVQIAFNSQFDEDATYLATLDERNLNQFIRELNEIKENFEKTRLRRKEIMYKTDFTKIYTEMERKYHPYPTQMARSDAFGHALRDGVIDKETYDAAHEYYGNLWNYVGD